MVEAASQCSLPLYSDPGLMAQSDRNLVLDTARPVFERRFLQLRGPASGAHRRLHRGLQHQCRPIRLDKKARISKAVQKPQDQSIVIMEWRAPPQRRRHTVVRITDSEG